MSTMPKVRKPEDSTTPAPATDDAIHFACEVARIAAADKTEDIAVLDLRGLSGLTDFFVIGTGTSERQMGAVLDHIQAHARKRKRKAFNVADARETAWVLADYVDVIIHLFDAQHRLYYDLDGLWGDAPRVPWQAPEPEGQQAAAD
jgi:ribosome-associated protein